MDTHTRAADEKQVRDVILVLGMHRSGTSAVAGVLAKLGAAAPNDPHPTNSFNQRGYWESLGLMKFHDELLASAGSRWDDWRRFNPSWYETPVSAVLQCSAKQLIAAKFGDAPLVVFKDPRVCRFVPFWLKVFGELRARLHIVIPVRSPLEVAQSLRQRDGMPLPKSLLLWLRHTLDAEAATRGLPRSVVGWEEFLAHWRSAMERISREIGIMWPRLSDPGAREVDAFLSADLRRQRVDDAALARHPEIHEWTMSAYRALLALRLDPAATAACATLDRIRDRFDSACIMFGPALVGLEVGCEDLRAKADVLRGERDESRAHSDRIGAALAATIQDRDKTVATWQARLSLLTNEAADDMAKRDERIALLGKRVEQTRVEALRTQSEAAQARSMAEQARSEADHLRQRLVLAQSETERARAECARVTEQLDHVAREHAAVTGSTTWRLTAPFRRTFGVLPASLRRAARRSIRAIVG